MQTLTWLSDAVVTSYAVTPVARCSAAFPTYYSNLFTTCSCTGFFPSARHIITHKCTTNMQAAASGNLKFQPSLLSLAMPGDHSGMRDSSSPCCTCPLCAGSAHHSACSEKRAPCRRHFSSGASGPSLQERRSGVPESSPWNKHSSVTAAPMVHLAA